MAERAVGIALLGGGVVGSGVIKILAEQRDLLRRRTGLTFDIRHVVVRDEKKHEGQHANLPLTTDANKAIDDPKVEIVIELIGGTTTAADVIQRAVKLGKPVVTANKSLLAARGAELFGLAKKHNTAIAFEASCGGGIPIIDALSKGLIANRIDALVGIVNGTCNVILTRMTRNGWSYAKALEEAQKAGFAEADPTLDVSGRDAAQKLALLASLAFNVRVAENDIHVEGVDKIQPADINFAGELGYVIKLLAIAERANHGERVTLRVHPTLVHKDDVLAEVSGSFNAISVYGHALGHALFYGRGAGQMPTASAVVADLVSVALGTTPLAFKQLHIFPDATSPANVLPIEDLQSRYYIRLMARDVPGVMAEVTEALGRDKISLSAVLQRESDEGQYVPVVITTHMANEGAMRQALKAIDSLKTIQPPSVCLRIIDQPREFGGG
ncbi:MAG TPA: homoserine dehydrogenase [Tepidisphaeraceae bacterium]|nr:homoserine dehydrogenase [Tepidisphaeraceae bacterium]